MIDEATIEEAGRRIGAAAPDGSRVILFGSHARGEAHDHSDLDIMVIEPRSRTRPRSPSAYIGRYGT
jgi:predicted nucleotidyltransferase